jgi:ribonucleotide reductase alpha subunit
MEESVTTDQVAEIYRTAWGKKLKGITVFRYGSKDRQVLELGVRDNAQSAEHSVRCDPFEYDK